MHDDMLQNKLPKFNILFFRLVFWNFMGMMLMGRSGDKTGYIKWHWASLGLRYKFTLAFIVMTLLPLLVTTLITFRETEKAMKHAVFEKNQYLAMNMADEIEQLISEKARMLRIFVKNAEITSMEPDGLVAVLKDVYGQYPEMGIAFVVDSQGVMIARSDGVSPDIDYSDREYFKEAMTTGATAFSGVITSRSTGKSVIAVAEPIRRSDSSIAGLLVVNVEVKKMLDMIHEHLDHKGGEVFIVNRAGRVLFPDDRGQVGMSADVSALPPVKRVIHGGKGWSEYEFGGQKKLAGYSYIKSAGWGLVFQQPYGTGMSEVYKLKVTNSLIIFSAAILAVLIGVSIAAAMVRPITEISAAAERMSDGDLSVQLDVGTRDEIGQLAGTFNRMSAQLEKRDESIRKIHAKVQRQNDYLNSLHEVSLGIINRMDDAGFLEEIVRRSGELVGTVNGFLYLLDHERAVFVRKIGLGVYAADMDREIRLGEGLVSRVKETGKPVLIADYSSWAGGLADPLFRQIGAVLQVPLKSESQFIGTVGLAFTDKTREFGEAEIGVLVQFAKMASIAYENRRLFFIAKNELASREKAEEQTRQYAMELERSNRELEQYAYVSSHDLQEPLGKIIAFGDRLKTACADTMDEKGLDCLDRMQAAATRMRQLMEGLMEYSRVTTRANPLQEVDLAEVVQEVVSNLEYRIEVTGAQVEAGPLPDVQADWTQMIQLFQNLISNALKYHRAGVPPRVIISSRSNQTGDREIWIEDNGIGFDEKHLDRIFVPFQRLHARNEFEGTGMGLAICSKIAERHGWKISARSEVGKGSVFVILLGNREIAPI